MFKILYRDSDPWDETEHLAATSAFGPTLLKPNVIHNRTLIGDGEFVVGRYSVLPFYKETEEDLLAVGAMLVNTYKQHRYVADLRNWVGHLEEHTPETWFSLSEAPRGVNGHFVVKGATNSHKFKWDTHMFAKDFEDARDIVYKLMDDTLIGQQDIYLRRYVPLKTYMISANGLPITDEYRIFVCNRQILSIGYYWASHVEDLGHIPVPRHDWRNFAEEMIERIGDNVAFYAMDIAMTEYGEWIVVELNDAQMSGLSCNNPFEMYARLKQSLCGMLVVK